MDEARTRPKSKAPAKPQLSETLIYIGPSLSRGRLAQYTTFRGGLPERVEALKEEYPKLGRLIVPVSQLSEAKARAATVGTAEQTAVQEIMGGTV